MQRIDPARPRIAYLGPSGSFSEEAAFLRFPKARFMLDEEATIRGVFEAVEKSGCLGVVPIENSLEGSVNQTLDLLWEYDLRIVGEIQLAVNHCLLARPNTRIGNVSIVYSHPNALGQCARFLTRRLSHAALREVDSTSRAASLAAKKPKAAAIASQRAAKKFGLAVLARGIQDYGRNYTRFIVISREDAPKSRRAKTSIIFVTHHRPGALWRALAPFARRHLNLTKIESRPVKSRSWEYAFHVDFEGHAEDPVPARALRELTRRTTFLKVLGSYPYNGRSNWAKSSRSRK